MYLNNDPESENWEISLHILGKLLINLKKQIENKSRKNNEIIEEVGAITKYGWHAYNKKKDRHNALKQRVYIEGFDKTIGTLLHLRTYWRSVTSPNHEYLPELDDDILWLQTYPIQNKKIKNILFNKYMKLKNNNVQLKNKKPHSMFFVNLNE